MSLQRFREVQRELETLTKREEELLLAISDRARGSRRMTLLVELCDVIKARGRAANRLSRIERPAIAWMRRQ